MANGVASGDPGQGTTAGESVDSAGSATAQEEEWLRQTNLIYVGLIGIALVMMQPFLTAKPDGPAAKICVVAFAVAIPLLAALVMVNRQESFRRRATNSATVTGARAIAQLAAFTGIVAGFWHIWWIAGAALIASAVIALGVHSAGYLRLEWSRRRNTSSS